MLKDDFKLDDVWVSPRNRTIEVEGEARRIDRKAMQVLGCLVASPEAAVTKKEIFSEVWPQDFVSDEVLTVAISRLRRALGDSARSPRFIETVPQVGYRLIATITEHVSEVEQVAAGASLTKPKTAGPRFRAWGVAMMLVAGSVAAGWWAGIWQPAVSDAPSQIPSLSRISSLAVLPLSNLTGDRDQEHLAEGITEALITGLAGHGNLRVMSRASVERYQRKRPDLTEIARQLGVDGIVEGSVQRSGNRLRIAIRLTDASGDRHLWAETFDGEMEAMLDLQQAALVSIRRQIQRDPGSPLEQKVSSLTPEVYEGYLRGRYLLGQSGESPIRLLGAVRELEAVVASAPDFADAHIALAEAWLALGENGWVEPGQAFGAARSTAEQALKTDSNSASAHALLGMVLFLHDWSFEAAERTFRQALEIDGDEILARDGYSRLLTVMGRFDEALAQQKALAELNPLIYHQPYLAFIFNMARQHERALSSINKQLEIAPDSARLQSHLTSTYRWLGRTDQVLSSFKRYLRLIHTPPHKIEQIELAFNKSGIAGVGLSIFEHLEELAEHGEPVSAMSEAEVLAIAGDHGRAIEQLERALSRREPTILQISQSPDYDGLRSNPRFREMLREIGLPEKAGSASHRPFL